MTTLRDFGGILGRPLGHFLLGSCNSMVTARGLCVKWPSLESPNIRVARMSLILIRNSRKWVTANLDP